MEHINALKCVLCSRTCKPDETEYVCPDCGDEGILSVHYDHDRIARSFDRSRLAADDRRSIWRYEPLLPVTPESPRTPLTVGWTPLYRPEQLERHVGVGALYVKDDGRNPTASLKDRASAIAVSRALAQKRNIVSTASTGNAASSLAGLCASLGLPCVIFVPEDAPPAKISQLLVFGSKVFAVRGTYDDAFDLCLTACNRFGWYCRNTAYNPYMAEGKKTVVLEICEQLDFDPPDWVVISAGDGCITDGVGQGINDLHELKLIPRMPRIAAIQSEGSAAIYNAWKSGTENVVPVTPTTIADSISVGKPRDAVKALRAIRRTDGVAVTVTDEAILEAGRLLGRMAGVFAEPAGATPLAGVLELVSKGVIKKTDRVALVVSGNGLKDAAGASKGAGRPTPVQPDGADLDQALKNAGVSAP